MLKALLVVAAAAAIVVVPAGAVTSNGFPDNGLDVRR